MIAIGSAMSPYAEVEQIFGLTCHLTMINHHIWTEMTEWKTLLTLRHSMNAFSEPRPGRTLELVKVSKR